MARACSGSGHSRQTERGTTMTNQDAHIVSLVPGTSSDQESDPDPMASTVGRAPVPDPG
jgi:hypothetical protein